MMDYIKAHKLISLIVLVLLIGIAWWEFTSNASSGPLVTTAGPAGIASTSQDAQLVASLLQLQSVSLNGAILSDPGFLALQDFTTQVVSEPIGRTNPFAPITPGSIVSTSTQKVSPNLFAPAR